jgi:hypothetical protein
MAFFKKLNRKLYVLDHYPSPQIFDQTHEKERKVKNKQDLLGQVSRLQKREEQIPSLEWVNPVGPGVS